MPQSKWLSFVLVFVALLVPAWVIAQEDVATQGGVSFVSGGVGLDSQERLRAREKEFNLKLVFTLVEGNYVADAGVVLKNAAGKILLEATADGPFFLAKLPAGKYTVIATLSGKSETRMFAIRSKGLHTEYLRWPSNPETDFTLPPEGKDK